MVGFTRAALTGVVKIVTDALCSARRRAMSVSGMKWPGASHGIIRKCGAWDLALETLLLLISITRRFLLAWLVLDLTRPVHRPFVATFYM
jgi:hypothetical protein